MNSTVIQSLCAELGRMRRSRAHDRLKPHKLLMLLSVLDLIDAGELQRNQVVYDERLRRQFSRNFARLAGPGDVCQPGPPFFHLRNSTFWHHRIRGGREDAYAQITRMGAATSWITDNIEYAYLSPEVYEELQNESSRAILRVAINRMLELTNASPEDEE